MRRQSQVEVEEMAVADTDRNPFGNPPIRALDSPGLFLNALNAESIANLPVRDLGSPSLFS